MADLGRHQMFVATIVFKEASITEQDVYSAIKEGLERDLGISSGAYISQVRFTDSITLGNLTVKEGSDAGTVG